MKTNVAIELSDDQRRALANAIDGKANQRMASRSDVNAVAQGAVDALLAIAGSESQRSERVEPDPITARQTKRPSWEDHPNLVKYANEIDEGMRAARAKIPGFSEQSYLRGWTSGSFR
jgi:hypothetical protein